MLVVSGCFNGMLTNIAVLKAKAIHDERTVALHIFKRTVICTCYDMKYTGTVQIQTSWIYMNLSYDGLSQERNHTSSFTQGKSNCGTTFNVDSLNKIAHVTHIHSETTQAIMISPPFRDHLPPNGSSNCFLVPLYSAERRWLSTSLKAKKGSASASVIISKAMVSGCCSIHCGSSKLTTGWLSTWMLQKENGGKKWKYSDILTAFWKLESIFKYHPWVDVESL